MQCIILLYLFYFSFSKGKNSCRIFELCISANIWLNQKVNQQTSGVKQLRSEDKKKTTRE